MCRLISRHNKQWAIVGLWSHSLSPPYGPFQYLELEVQVQLNIFLSSWENVTLLPHAWLTIWKLWRLIYNTDFHLGTNSSTKLDFLLQLHLWLSTLYWFHRVTFDCWMLIHYTIPSGLFISISRNSISKPFFYVCTCPFSEWDAWG